MFLKVIEQKT